MRLDRKVELLIDEKKVKINLIIEQEYPISKMK